MQKSALALLGAGILGLGLCTSVLVAQRETTQPGITPRGKPASTVRPNAAGSPRRSAASVRMAPAHAPRSLSAESQRAIIGEYCLECHDKREAKGELVLEDFDPARPEQKAAIAEKMIRKLRAGMMPPAGAERPDEATVAAFAGSLEARLDRLAAARPNPGRRTFQRLNRSEYSRSIHDLLGLDVDVTAFLPPDTISNNFDNIADVQSFSPTLLEGLPARGEQDQPRRRR